MRGASRPSVLVALLAAGLLLLTGCTRTKDDVVGRRSTPTTGVALAPETPLSTPEPGEVTIGVEATQAVEAPAETGGIVATQEAGATGDPTISSGGGIAPSGTNAEPPAYPAPEAQPTSAPSPTTITVEVPVVVAGGEAGATTEAPAETAAAPPAEAAATGGTVAYTVQSGDTLYSLAQRFNTTVEAIQAANNLNGTFIVTGQTLQIPTGQAPASGAAPGAPPPATDQTTYVVQRGDTLSSIAQRFGTSVEAIKAANNLTSNIIHAGNTLIIPVADPAVSASGAQRTHVVQPGDTLYSLARRYGTTVDAIKAANGLTNNLIYVGQTLIIP